MLGGLDEVEIHRDALGAGNPLVARVRSRTVTKVDSIGLVVRMRTLDPMLGWLGVEPKVLVQVF